MSIESAILSINDWMSLNSKELSAALNTVSVERRDETIYYWVDIVMMIGKENAETLRQKLEGNGYAWAVYQFGGKGLRLSDPAIQDIMQALSQLFPEAGQLAIKGVYNVTPYQASGGSGIVTEEEVGSVLAEMLLRDTKAVLLEAARDSFEQFRVALNEWNGLGDPPVMGK